MWRSGPNATSHAWPLIVIWMVAGTVPGIVGELILKCSVAEPVLRVRTDKISPSAIAIDYVVRQRLFWSSPHEILPVLLISQRIIKRTASAVGIVNQKPNIADEVVVVLIDG